MTWLPSCVRRDGPTQKQGYGHIPSRTLADIQGVCGHSMEGSLAAAMGELDRETRLASWTLSNPRAGKMLQHYELEAVTWGNGSPTANKLFISIEHEGAAGEPLTGNQVTNLTQALREIAVVCPQVLPYARTTSVREHNEMTVYGADPTACPSGRIPWMGIIAALEDDMTPEQEAALKQAVADIATLAVQREALDKRVRSLEESRAVLATQVAAAFKQGGPDVDAIIKIIQDRLND